MNENLMTAIPRVVLFTCSRYYAADLHKLHLFAESKYLHHLTINTAKGRGMVLVTTF